VDVEAADRIGARTILTGHGSDELTAWSPLYIADLLRGGRWYSAAREAAIWAQALNRGFWSTMNRFALEPLAPVLLREGIRHSFRSGYGRWPHLGWFSIPPWIRPEFARRHHLKERALTCARQLSRPPVSRSVQLNILENSAGDWSQWYLAGPRGIEIRHPFRDTRLMCFALKHAQRFRRDPHERKPVLQVATKGILPEPIRTRRDKRGFDGIYGLGLAKNLPHLEEMVMASRIRELDMIDAEKLVDVMRQAALGIGDLRARERMDKTLALVAWFDQVVPHRSPVIGPTPRKGVLVR
jgi:asparagine synthase (glutamine-hydrolysing)